MSRRGISKLINYLKHDGTSGKDLNKFQDELTSIIEDSKFSLSGEEIKEWGDLVGDRNKIHTSKKAALKAGLEDTPVHGTYLAAQCEQYILKNLRFFTNFIGEQLVYAGQSIKFGPPLLPNIEAKPKLGKVETFADGIDMEVLLTNEEGDKFFSGTSKIRHKRRDYSLSQKENSFIEGKFVTERRDEIDVNPKEDRDDLGKFYDLLKIPQRNFTPITFPCAFPVSALVDSALNESDVFLGVYRNMSFDFHDYAGLGSFKSVIRMPKEPRRGLYDFEIVGVQEGIYILSGSIRCLTNQEINV